MHYKFVFVNPSYGSTQLDTIGLSTPCWLNIVVEYHEPQRNWSCLSTNFAISCKRGSHLYAFANGNENGLVTRDLFQSLETFWVTTTYVTVPHDYNIFSHEKPSPLWPIIYSSVDIFLRGISSHPKWEFLIIQHWTPEGCGICSDTLSDKRYRSPQMTHLVRWFSYE